jgi:hypothetical protein
MPEKTPDTHASIFQFTHSDVAGRRGRVHLVMNGEALTVCGKFSAERWWRWPRRYDERHDEMCRACRKWLDA